MCLFVSESDEVFGTLRMYGAAACCNFRVHGRNVVLWAPSSYLIYVGNHMPPDLCAAWINLGAPRSGGQVDDIWVAPR